MPKCNIFLEYLLHVDTNIPRLIIRDPAITFSTTILKVHVRLWLLDKALLIGKIMSLLSATSSSSRTLDSDRRC